MHNYNYLHVYNYDPTLLEISLATLALRVSVRPNPPTVTHLQHSLDLLRVRKGQSS